MESDDRDYHDPAIEEAWCEARRQDVASYLDNEGLKHGRVGEWPAWHVAPYVSVWAIESAVATNVIGWWAIAGDLPTDYLSGGDASDPREAVRAFARRWRGLAADMSNGLESDEMSIGQTADERRELAPLLKARADLLSEMAENEDIWIGIVNED